LFTFLIELWSFIKHYQRHKTGGSMQMSVSVVLSVNKMSENPDGARLQV